MIPTLMAIILLTSPRTSIASVLYGVLLGKQPRDMSRATEGCVGMSIVTEARKILAAALTALICLFGLTETAAAATGATKHRHVDSKAVVTGHGTPEYAGRKPGDHVKLDKKLNERARLGGLSKSRA